MLSCPISFEKTEFYLQILLHAYKFILESNQPICLKLIKRFEQKFDYELNSNINIASAMSNVSKLKTWYRRSFSGEHFESIINKLKTALFDATTVLIDKNNKIINKSIQFFGMNLFLSSSSFLFEYSSFKFFY